MRKPWLRVCLALTCFSLVILWVRFFVLLHSYCNAVFVGFRCLIIISNCFETIIHDVIHDGEWKQGLKEGKKEEVKNFRYNF